MFLSLELEERPGGRVIFLEALHTGKRNGNKKFFFSAWCLSLNSYALWKQRGCAYMRSVYSRASASHCISPSFSVSSLFLFPRLISNPSIAGGGLLRGSQPFVGHYLVVWECCEHPARPFSGCLGGALLALAAAGRAGGAGAPRQGSPAPSPGWERRSPAALAKAALPLGSRRRCWQPRRIPRIVTQNPRHFQPAQGCLEIC